MFFSYSLGNFHIKIKDTNAEIITMEDVNYPVYFFWTMNI